VRDSGVLDTRHPLTHADHLCRAPRAVVRIWRLLGLDGPAPVTFTEAVG
jgi:hypothetical protein